MRIPFFTKPGVKPANGEGKGTSAAAPRARGAANVETGPGDFAVIPNVAQEKPLPELTERAKKSQSRDIQATDVVHPEELLDDIDFDPELYQEYKSLDAIRQQALRKEIVDDVMRNFKRAATARQWREESWYIAAAFERGNQWVEFDDTSRQLRELWTDPDARSYYKKVNFIGKLVKQNTARLMATEPDLDFVPIDGNSPLDRMSAKLRRQCWEHTKVRQKWEETKEQGIHWAHCFPGAFKVVWDDEAFDDVPKFAVVDAQDDEAADIGSDDDPVAAGQPDPGSPAALFTAPKGQAPPPPMPAAAPAAPPMPPQGTPGASVGPMGQEDDLNPLTPPPAPAQAPVPPSGVVALPKMLKIVGSVAAQVGLPRIEYVQGFDYYPDPDAHDWDQLRYIVHARRVPISELQKRFGTPAYAIMPDRGSGSGAMEPNYVDVRLSGITGDNRYPNAEDGDYVVLYERYEFPSPKYRKGRYSAVADGELVSHKRLPDQEYPNPFVPIGYTKEVNSIWHRGIVTDMQDSQVAYNAAKSHLLSRMRMDKVTVLAPDGSGLKPDDYIGGLDYRKITYKVGLAPPQLQMPQNDWDKYLLVMQSSKEEMEDLIGLHDNSRGEQEPGAQSGRAIWLLQQADNSVIRPVIRIIEAAELAVAERVLSLWEQFGSEPRLIGLDDEAPDKIPASRLFLPDLMAAGRARAQVTTGSAMPESPGAEEEQLEAWYKMGVFGQPGTPEAARNFLDALPTLKSSKIVGNIEETLQRLAARLQSEAAAAEAQKANLAMQAEAFKADQEIRKIQAKGQVDATIQAQKFQLESTLPNPAGSTPATPQEEAEARIYADTTISRYNAMLEAAAREHETQLDVGAKLAVEQAKHAHSLHKDHHDRLGESTLSQQEHEQGQEAAAEQARVASVQQAQGAADNEAQTIASAGAKARFTPKNTKTK